MKKGTDSNNSAVNKKLEQAARFPDMNPGPVLRVNFEGIILLSNIAARDILGKDLNGKNWPEMNPDIDPDLWDKIINSVEVSHVECQVGDRFFAFDHRTDPESKLVFVFGSDITQNKKDEKLLEEQKAFISEVARFPDMNPGPVIRTDFEGKILLSNKASENVYGKDLKGRNWLDICSSLNKEIWDQVTGTEEVVPVETQIDGKFFVFKHRSDLEKKFVFAFGMDITQQRQAETQLRQNEKMATLGTLAAGVAHEINNPAAANKRAAQQLRELLAKIDPVREQLYTVNMGPGEMNFIRQLVSKVNHPEIVKMTSMESLNKETELEDWLEDYGIEDAFELGDALLSINVDSEIIEEMTQGLDAEAVKAIIRYVTMLIPIYELTHEIFEATSRITEIVGALKNYSYVGQAPVQKVNIHKGIDDTLIILKNKLKDGIEIRKEYSPDFPEIMAFGSELNQVWTNLIDNATDALNGEGIITIRTITEEKCGVVQIEDNGHGIPDDIKSRIFDPFFTTKDVGKGTGLGLNTSYGIVVEKHKGVMEVESKPGKTIFTVKIPYEV